MMLLLYFLLIMMIGCSFFIFTAGSRNAAILPAPEEDTVLEYKEMAELANLDWADMIIFDTVRYENDFDMANPKETAWEFVIVNWEQWKEVEQTDGDGNSYTVNMKIAEGTASNKEEILKYITDNLAVYPEEIRDILEVMKVLKDYSGKTVNGIEHFFNIGSKDLEDVMKDNNFTEDQKDWARLLISENIVYEMFGEVLNLPDHIPVPGGSFFAWPTPTLHTVTSPYGWRIHPITGERRFHYGIDIAGANAHGQPVISVADGEVFQVNYSSGEAGYNIRIRHYDEEGNEWQSRYSHLSLMTVRIGDKVRQGDVIGAVGSTGGSTGPHLHFELKFEGQLLDPYPYIK